MAAAAPDFLYSLGYGFALMFPVGIMPVTNPTQFKYMQA